MAADWYYQRYEKLGYVFPDEILTRYALSLATKPFLILSGISGTGKTKIAQLFDVPLPKLGDGSAASAAVVEGNQNIRDYILLRVTDGLLYKDGRANIAFRDVSRVLDDEEMVALNAEVERKRRSNNDGNICEPIVLSVETPEGNEISMGLYLQRASSPLARLRAKSKKRGDEREYDSQAYFQNNYKEGDVIKLRKVSKHRLRIVSVNEEEVVREHRDDVLREFGRASNKCFISVKSNWTDSSEIFGYYNPLTNKYHVTKLLRFILLANDYPDIPFFLILDEMNLARVEHYFSDFLSCIESRVLLPDGTFHQESVHLHSSSYVETDDDEYEEISGSVEIPLNLYVTGTVNIDDTTYMFSPKVLDRANVIEFNDVLLSEAAISGGIKLSSFPNFLKFKKSDFSMFFELGDVTRSYISQIMEIMKKRNMHFGYRTVAEISHFILNARECISGDNETEIAALDIQILQKILPKLHGSYAKLNEVIKELIFFLSEADGVIENFDINEMHSFNIEKMQFKRSLSKLIRMYESLASQGFASFIE